MSDMSKVCDIEGAFSRGWWAGWDSSAEYRENDTAMYPTKQFLAELAMLEADWLKFKAECEKAIEESMRSPSYRPKVIPCADCGGTVVYGYCCSTCGSKNPREKK